MSTSHVPSRETHDTVTLDMPTVLTAGDAEEIERNLAIGVLAYLTAAGIGLAIAVYLALPDGASVAKADTRTLVPLCVCAGALGSTVSALLSAAQRFANGWELDRGLKYPSNVPKDKFSVRITPFLVVRPVLGAVMGIVVMAGFAGGNLITTNTLPDSYSPYGMLFLALLGGLFAKTFLERLRLVFKTLVGATKVEEQ